MNPPSTHFRNPFLQRASDQLIRLGYRGGQHGASVGDSTKHRVALPFDPEQFEAWQNFEQERRRIIESNEATPPF